MTSRPASSRRVSAARGPHASSRPQPEDRPLSSRRHPESTDATTGRTILVVEDEPSVRELVVRVLRRTSHEILAEAEPLRVLKRPDLDGVDLLVSDVVMPGLTGPDLYRRLRQTYPTLRAVFMSGYFERGPHGENPIPPGARFLAKPFTPSALLLVVQEALSGVDEIG